MAWFMGIDIGSVTSKGVLTKDGELSAYHLIPSGINYKAAAQKIKRGLLKKAGLSTEDIACIVATGCGAGNVSFATQQTAHTICCARGINNTFPLVRVVIDIEGQASHVIRVDEHGRVTNFAVSEKCAAGSGRFLQIIANVLRISLEDIGPLSLGSKDPVTFTTGCAVFAETEAITRVAEGISKEDILAGVHTAMADKISVLVRKVGLDQQCAISGGGALDIGLVKSIEEKLQVQLLVPSQPQIITALGAAIIARERGKSS